LQRQGWQCAAGLLSICAQLLREPLVNEDNKTVTKDNPYAQYHEVVKGDTLSKIAEHYYGDMMLYKKIFEANRDLLDDPNKIKPGQKLLIP
jgi:nucleoid-associated protein YgaU